MATDTLCCPQYRQRMEKSHTFNLMLPSLTWCFTHYLADVDYRQESSPAPHTPGPGQFLSADEVSADKHTIQTLYRKILAIQ